MSTWNSEFYNDRTWKKIRKSYMMSKNYVCEKCGEPAEIVHHKIHLSPENMGNFEIMYGEKNLQALCRECHSNIHYASYLTTQPELEFDENGNLVQKYEPDFPFDILPNNC